MIVTLKELKIPDNKDPGNNSNNENDVKLEKRFIFEEWKGLLKDALHRKCYKGTEKLLSLSPCFVRNNNNNLNEVRTPNITKRMYSDSYHVRLCTQQSVEDEDEESKFSNLNDCTILAVETNDARFMKLFHTYNFTIDLPQKLDCECTLCKTDQLGQSKKRINALKALSNPIWIRLTSNDPFLTSFQITNTCRILSSFQDCFEISYTNIVKQNKDLCCALLDQVENEKEVQSLMKRYHDKFYPFKNVKDLDFVRLGIQYKQKEVVSHSVTQHVITSLVNNGIPYWKTGTILQRLFVIGTISLLYPFTSLVNIVYPSSYIGRFTTKPMVKFINGAASFITWLALVASLSIAPKSGLRVGDSPTAMEVIVFVWLISLFMQELKELNGIGKKEYFGSGWNWIDINMIFLMLSAYLMWTIIYFMNPLHEDKSFVLFISVADSCFALAIIFSYFRMMYLCQITRYLGLLQLCLGRMIQVILQFLFISIVVVSSFSVAMVFLYNATATYKATAAVLSKRLQNTTYVDVISEGGYDGFLISMITLGWASLNMIGRDSLSVYNDGTLIQILSYSLFTLYHVITMIILLNMLIAMMSNSYQQIENNIEVEHKYARTQLWLQYIGDNNQLPCPFNLLPSYTICKNMYTSIKCWMSVDNIEKIQQEKKTRKSIQKKRYQELCKKLMDRYIMQRYKLSLNDILLTSAATVDIETGNENNFHAIVNKKVKTWSKVFCTSNENGLNNHHGLCNGLPYDEVLCNYDADVYQGNVSNSKHPSDTTMF